MAGAAITECRYIAAQLSRKMLMTTTIIEEESTNTTRPQQCVVCRGSLHSGKEHVVVTVDAKEE